MKVFKYHVPIHDSFSITMPADAKILSFQPQGTDACIWALVDPEKPSVERYFIVRGTGHEIEYLPDVLVYIGTIQMAFGSLVFHLFEDIT